MSLHTSSTTSTQVPLSIRILGVGFGFLAFLFMLFIMSWTLLDVALFYVVN